MSSETAKTKILIVEDERLIAENNSILLRSLGYVITEIVSTAELAEKSIQKNRPDVVLLDIMLQGDVDGIQFADTLRKRYDIPFVYATAYADEYILERAKITTPYGYVLKPFSERDLYSNIEMALYKHQSEAHIQYLNRVLQALNHVNQIMVRRKNPEDLLTDTCKALVGAQTFSFAWACLMDGEEGIGYQTAVDHLGRDLLKEMDFPYQPDGEVTNCVALAFHPGDRPVTRGDGPDCNPCSLSDIFQDEAILTARLEYEGRLHGIIVCVLPVELAEDEQIIELLSEVALDLGFTLNTRETEAFAARAEENLKASEERYRLLAETAPDLIMLYDPDGSITYANHAASSLTGFPIPDLLQKNIQDLIDGPARSRLLEISDRSSRHREQISSFVADLRCLEQESIPLELITTVVKEKDKPRAFLVIGRDIRERQQAEMELRKLSQAVEQSPVAVIITSASGEISYVNPKFTEMTGFTQSEILGKYPAVLKIPDDPQQPYRTLVEAVESGDEWHGELKSRRANEEEFWVQANITPLRNSEGNTIHYVGILEDVTERRRVQQQVESARESYEDIFNSINDGIYILDTEGHFLAVNRSAQRTFGFSESDFMGIQPPDIGAPDLNDYQAMAEHMQAALKGETRSFEFWGQRKDGSILPTEIQLSRANYFGETVILVAARDISERKESEEKLKAALERAQESERVKSLFLANMSHEIRTPLTSIIGYIDLIYNRIEELAGADEKNYFDVIRRNSDRLTKTVHGILDLSQIEAGAIEMKPRDMELNGLLGKLVKNQQPLADRQSLTLSFTPLPSNRQVYCDEQSMVSAINNILENALVYTEEGEVSVELRQGKGAAVNLEIRDTGIGISPEYMDHLFDAFSQESTGYTKDYQGLGLGLAIAKKCLDLNGVDVAVSSSKGEGTRFLLTFPKTTAPGKEALPVPETAAPPPSARHDGRRPTVLIVEDDPNARRLFGLFLRDHYKVCFGETVREGRKALKENPIDLVITDLSLVGGEDGLDLVKSIRKQKKLIHLPVVALTAHAFLTDRDRCLEAGCNDFLTKPIFKHNLLEAIERNLPH